MNSKTALPADSFTVSEPDCSSCHRARAACWPAADRVLDWLGADLSAYSTLASQDNPAIQRAIQQQLVQWQQDPDLASVRDRTALDGLPEHDRAAWQSLWHDGAALLHRLATTAADS
jgi:hypothetical protein